MATLCGCSRSSVKRVLHELRERGSIDIKGKAKRLKGGVHHHACNRYYLLDQSEWGGHREPGNVCIKRAPSSERGTGMEKQVYKSYEELPMLLTVSDVAAMLGVSRAGAYELARSEGSRC